MWRRAFAGAVGVFIAVNVVLSLVALLPALYSQTKWDLALVLGWIFILAAAAVVVTGAGWLATSGSSRPTPRGAEGV